MLETASLLINLIQLITQKFHQKTLDQTVFTQRRQHTLSVMMTFIRLQSVNKNYGQTRAAIDLDLTIPKSTIAVLLGPSGCGKTITLRLIAGLEKPDAGNIWIGEQQVSGGQVWVSATQRQIGGGLPGLRLIPSPDRGSKFEP